MDERHPHCDPAAQWTPEYNAWLGFQPRGYASSFHHMDRDTSEHYSLICLRMPDAKDPLNNVLWHELAHIILYQDCGHFADREQNATAEAWLHCIHDGDPQFVALEAWLWETALALQKN